MKATRAVYAVVFVLVGSATCSKSPTGLEQLPITPATVAAAVALVTTDTVYVPASCGGTPALNCPGGVAASPAPLVLTRDSLHVLTTPDTLVYHFSAWVTVVTPADIPISTLGLECGLAINTAAAPSPDVQIDGTVRFVSQTTGGPIDRVDITQLNISGLDTGDVAINGGVTCVIADFGLTFYFGTLTTMLQDQLTRSFCGAPGAKLLEPCPAQGVALSRQARRRRMYGRTM